MRLKLSQLEVHFPLFPHSSGSRSLWETSTVHSLAPEEEETAELNQAGHQWHATRSSAHECYRCRWIPPDTTYQRHTYQQTRRCRFLTSLISYYPYGWSSAYPYPYSYPPGTSPVTGATNPFSLCFIRGNIAICSGCHNRYTKTKQPPHDLCIRHKEWHKFIPAGAGTEPSHARFANVYYHCHPQCVWLHCPDFVPTHLDTSEVLDDLSQTHKAHLNLQFGLHFS